MTREEAIKLVKRIKGAMVYTEEEKEAIETLIPELRESDSEDEKFQKYILKVCKECVEANDKGLELSMSTTKKLLAYFEKQKAKERLDRMAPIYNDKELFESALEKAWKYYNESASRKVDSFEDDYIECVFSKGFREGFLYRGKQKEPIKEEVEPITDGLSTEFQKQVSYLIASSINKEHEYSEGYVKWVSQSLLEYAKFAMSQQEKQKELPTNEEMLRTLRVEYEKGVADTIAKYEEKEQEIAECDKETEIQKAFREGEWKGRQEVFDNPGAYGLEMIDNVFGFKIGDKVRLVDGDGRKHIIKYFEKIKGLHGPDFYCVIFEDNAALDHIIPGEEYPNGYFTQMEKFEE